ncbi:MAG: T9SS type A sorting domain-containing protein [Bacteroidota bacterium]|jgi:hypothetical protein
MKSHIKVMILILAFLLIASLTSFAKEKIGNGRGLAKTAAGQPYILMNANNVTSWVHPDGLFNWLVSQSWNGEFPRGSGVGTIYSEGIVFGGLVNDAKYSQTLRVTGNTYFVGMQAGAIHSDGTTDDQNDAGSRAFGVRPDMPPSIQNDSKLWPDLTVDAATFFQKPQASVSDADRAQIAAQYFKDWTEWPASKGAPWSDDRDGTIRHDGAFDPTNPHHIPGIAGASKTIWFVCNDLNPTVSQTFAGSPPTGMEEQMTLWAYASSTPLNNMIFKQVKLIYKGNPGILSTSHIDSMYVVQWADPDDGDGGDDFAGSDSTLNLNYVYNSTSHDAKFAAIGLAPAAVGFVFLNGVAHYTGNMADSAVIDFQWRHGYGYWHTRPDPAHPGQTIPTPLTAAEYFASGTTISDPDNATYEGTKQWYNLMRGDLPRPAYPAGSPFYSSSIYASDHNIVTPFVLSGNPVTGTGWIDGSDLTAGDRRLVTVHGPFQMNLNDTAESVIALVDGMGTDNLSSITALKFTTTFAARAFTNLFKLPAPPPPPQVSASELDKEIILNWGGSASSNATETTVNKHYAFQGYNVYQFPSASSTLKDAIKIATYDLAVDANGNLDTLKAILAPAIDPVSGATITVVVQAGTNSGIKRFQDITKDYIRNRPLIDGQTYFFGVTAYSFNPIYNDTSNNNPDYAPSTPCLENSPTILALTPHMPNPGNRLHSAYNDPITIVHSSGIATATMQAGVIDPAKITGDNYKVFISVKDSLVVDTLGNKVGVGKWNIVDVTKGDTLLKNIADYSYSSANPIIDGFQIGLKGQPYYVAGQELGSLTYTPKSDFNFSGVNATPYVADQFINSMLTADQVAQDVQMEFDNSAGGGQNAYCFTRTAATGSATAPYDGYYPQPFKVWELNPDGTHKRQIDFVFMEANPSPDNTNNHIWAPGAQTSDREYWFFVTEDYSPTAKAKYTGTTLGSALGADSCVWSGWYILADPTAPAYVNGDVWTIKTAKPLKTVDTWTFTTAGMNSTTSTDLAKSDIDKINVFPNPYYGMNNYETSRLNKYVEFSHLPTNATIRIFNLAGVLVRTLTKSDATTQFTKWDLRNEKSLPVASGIYIIHIDMPDIGKSKILKLALVQEVQILPTY